MAKPICADYQTPFLLPPSLEQWIPANHPARFIRAFVESLALEQLGFRAQPCLDGRPPYSNEMLLRIWLFGYLLKIRTPRALERACHEQISLLWLSGMNYPDHNTLWRFWRDNKKAFHGLFKQSVKVALKTGLVGLALQAVDGTKIQAACSGHTGWTKEQMEKLDQSLENEIATAEQNITKERDELPNASYTLSPELSEPAKLKQKIQEGLKQLEQDGRTHYHSDEPEARRMPCEGRNRFAYNAQAVVDDKAGVITAVEVIGQENDVGQLVPMLERAKENTGASANQNVADSGYGSGTDLLAAQKTSFNIVTALIPSAGEQEPYHASKFHYDLTNKTLECPRGTKLDPKHERMRCLQRVQIFRCTNRECPVRLICCKDPKGRKVEVWESRPAIVAMREKLKTPEGKYALKRRREVVERRFGNIKQHLGFRRWTAKGLEHARAQWAMLCLTINLQTLMQQTR